MNNTMTPEPDASVPAAPAPMVSRYCITMPAAAAASNPELAHRLTELVNRVYAKDEGDIWDSKLGVFERTNLDEIQGYLDTGELALVWAGEDPDGPVTQGMSANVASSCIGCARVHWVDASTGDISLLVCDEAARGSGVGRVMFQSAEDWLRAKGATTVQVELLVPDTWEHPSKARLRDWYSRMGYRVVRQEAMVWMQSLQVGEVTLLTMLLQDVLYPRLAPLLAGPSKLQVWQKPL
jgi:GNAT superfamily N-acetyltransferase